MDSASGMGRLGNRMRGLGLRLRVQVVSLLFVSLIFIVGGTIYHLMVRNALRQQYEQAMQSYAQRLGTALDVLGFDLNELSEASLTRVRPLFMEPLLGEGSYPMVVHPTGRIVLHFFREGDYFPMEVMERMANAPGRKGEFDYFFTDAASSERRVLFSYVPALRCFLAVETQPSSWGVTLTSNRLLSIGILIFIVTLIFTLLFSTYLGLQVSRFMGNLMQRMRTLSRGEVPPSMSESGCCEVKMLACHANELSDGLMRMENFAEDITANRLDAEYTPRGPSDRLGNALLSLRDSLRASLQESTLRHKEEEVRNWTNQGLAEIATLLRERSADIEGLSYAIMEHLVNYLHAQQGSLYLLSDEVDEDTCGGKGKNQFLHLVAAFAYNRRKYLQHELPVGEGLVGTCAREGATIHIDRVPAEYFDITSGVGGTPPKELLLVPLQTADAFLGVLELASLDPFLPHMISFVEALSASIAQTILSARTALQTHRLLEESQQRREQLHAQEEEMRQNLEEMQATQEEMERNSEQSRMLRQTIDRSALYGVFDEQGECISLNTLFSAFFSRAGILAPMEHRVQMNGFVWQGNQREGKKLSEVWSQLLEGDKLRGCFGWCTDGGEWQYAVGVFSRGSQGMESSRYGEEGATIFFLGNEVELGMLNGLQARASSVGMETVAPGTQSSSAADTADVTLESESEVKGQEGEVL